VREVAARSSQGEGLRAAKATLAVAYFAVWSYRNADAEVRGAKVCNVNAVNRQAGGTRVNGRPEADGYDRLLTAMPFEGFH
jgi:hypothetical protein